MVLLHLIFFCHLKALSLARGGGGRLKSLGYFPIAQCWCTTFGELTAINNIGR